MTPDTKKRYTADAMTKGAGDCDDFFGAGNLYSAQLRQAATDA
mgnify:CR=1 FL=1